LLRKIFLLLFFLQLLTLSVAATNLRDIQNKDEYIFILVHGITSDFNSAWNEQNDKWVPDNSFITGKTCSATPNQSVNFLEYLNDYLCLKGRVFGYTFSKTKKTK
jgi:hypothetical protein